VGYWWGIGSREGGTGTGVGKIYREGLHALYLLPGIIRLIRSRGMRFGGHVTCIAEISCT
jgi:hypothetical protein